MTTTDRKKPAETRRNPTRPELPGFRQADLKTHAGEHRAFSLAALSVEKLLELLGGDSDLDAADELLRRGLERRVR